MVKPATEDLDRLQFGRVIHKRPERAMSARISDLEKRVEELENNVGFLAKGGGKLSRKGGQS